MAIVIGIDHYAVDAWGLNGAVRDALAFARWAVGSGGVATTDLSLLLSARPAEPPDIKGLVAPVEATRVNLLKVLQAFKLKAAGKGADRLYFFYAGHGLSAPGRAPSIGPLIIPADTDDADAYIDAGPIGMDDFREAMQAQPPKEQIYFVDACRDAVPMRGASVQTQSRFWDVSKTTSDELATQAVLLATTAGQRAKEIRGRGVFSKVLIKGLQGIGPRLDEPLAYAARAARQRLVFNALFRFVESAIGDELGAKDLQVPYMTTNKGGVDVTLAEFGAGEIPLVNLSLLVEPDEARRTGRVEFMEWSRPHARYEARLQDPAPAGPPLAEQVELKAPGGSHNVRVVSDDFEEQVSTILLYEDKRIPIVLRARPKIVEPISFESVTGDVPPEDGHREIDARGTLAVSAPDRLARVAIHDGAGHELFRDYHEIERRLAPGLYRVTAELAGGDRVESHAMVERGRRTEIVLDLPAPLAGAACSVVAGAMGIARGRYAEPSENFGPVGSLRLGSLLAYAAWAARWPDVSGFHHLRAIAIDPLPALAPGASAIQVIVADLELPPAAGTAVSVVREADAAGPPLVIPLSPLPALPFVAQAAVPIDPGSAFVTVAGTTLAVCCLPGFVSVVIASRERGEKLAIEHYLNPIDPTRPVAPGFPAPLRDDIRLVELSWRALEEGDALDDVEYRGLVDGKRANPLLGLVAGYRMWNTRRAPAFASRPLGNMLRLFPALPDVHVLAGLYDPANRDDHLERAARIGTPVASIGFQVLAEWMARRALRGETTPLELRRQLVPGSAWTAWTADRAPAAGDTVPVITPTGRLYRDRTLLGPVPKIAGRVGWLEIGEVRSSCLVLNARQILCPYFAIEALAARADGGRIPAGAAALRLDGPGGPAHAVSAYLGPIAPLPPGGPDRLWPHVLELAVDLARPFAELRIHGERPVAGQRVAMIGFPQFQRFDVAFAQHFAPAEGVRHVMIGSVLEPPSDGFTFAYDGYGAPGTAGGLIIDLDRGFALGIHAGARRDAAGNRRSIGLATSAFAEELARRSRLTTDGVAA
ncbi:MAG TPA: caspase family protein [Kofleriaceae bacterium]